MDALDRTFRHLVQTIQTRYPAYLTQPFEVSELYQNILPYRHHRRELGLETNQDYEFVLLQLLAGTRDYLIIDEHMRDTLARELTSPNPDPGAFRQFAVSQVALSPAAVRLALEGAGASPVPALVGATRAASSATTQKLAAHRAMSAAAPATSPLASAAAAPVLAPQKSAPAAAAAPLAAAAQASNAPRRAAAPTPTPPSKVGAAAAPGRPMNTIVPQSGEQCRYCSGALPAGRKITFCPHCGQNLTIINCPACGTELELGWKFCTTCGRPVSST
jgi:hypothetical protein